MPELPEVETVKRALEKALVGRCLEKLVFRRADLRFALPPELPGRLRGQEFSGVQRRGKYIVVFVKNGAGFVLHLGMSGVIRIEVEPSGRLEEKHDHVAFYLDDACRIVFHDPRRFGFIEALEQKTWQTYPAFAAMGPEPLGNDFNGPVLQAALAGRKSNIKTALLDQKVVAGIGNIYACEALYYAGIDPQRSACSLSADESGRLAVCVQNVLRKAIEAGGSSLRDYRHTDGKLGYFQHQLAVYDRAGEACPGCECDMLKTGGVSRIVQGGRSTFYCRQKQV